MHSTHRRLWEYTEKHKIGKIGYELHFGKFFYGVGVFWGLKSIIISILQITDNWIRLLDDSQLNENLIDLNLSFCKNLTNYNLQLLNWSKLKYVGLFGLSGKSHFL